MFWLAFTTLRGCLKSHGRCTPYNCGLSQTNDGHRKKILKKSFIAALKRWAEVQGQLLSERNKIVMVSKMHDGYLYTVLQLLWPMFTNQPIGKQQKVEVALNAKLNTLYKSRVGPHLLSPLL